MKSRKTAQRASAGTGEAGGQAHQDAGAPKRAKGPSVPSLISAGMVIDGSITSDGEVQFDGTITGDIRAEGLVVGEGALIKGEVAAGKVRVCGKVEGVVRAMRVELAATAVIEGDVLHAALTVEDGARLDGKVCCTQNPLRGAERDALPTDRIKAELAERKTGRAKPDDAAAPKLVAAS